MHWVGFEFYFKDIFQIPVMFEYDYKIKLKFKLYEIQSKNMYYFLKKSCIIY